VKALWVDRTAPRASSGPENYRAKDYEFIRARIDDNPIYANDARVSPHAGSAAGHLRRAFLDGDWECSLGNILMCLKLAGTLRVRKICGWSRAAALDFIDWGFHHPSAVYSLCDATSIGIPNKRRDEGPSSARDPSVAPLPQDDHAW